MSKNKKILLVIEDQNLDKILTYLLKAWNYDVILCNDGNQALKLAAQKYPDLILIDAHLSMIDSLKLCKILKYDFITSYMPIIILIEKKQLRRSLLDIEQGVDDFLIKPPDPIDLEIRIALSLRSADHQFHANALTKLPGNKSIEKLIKAHLDENRTFSFAYLDINNFKSFNDKYGYIAGDRVILQTAKIITSTVKKLGNPGNFVGHIGGDDFVYLTTTDKEELIAQECINEFDRLMPFHYSSEDRKNGFIKAKDRSGHLKHIPLMGLSIAIVNNRSLKIRSIFELIEIAFEIKKFLKKHHTSNYLVNRRLTDTWTHDVSRRVTDTGLEVRSELKEQYDNELKAHPHRLKNYKPLGQIMLETHLLNEEQLNEALNNHWNTGQHLGEVVVSMGLSDEEHIKRLLEHQPDFTPSKSK
ncbi:MAG: diguanylate cyclase [Candidatus Omnitrophica bacterium]|nr:diguanylate cyclase [Candidatus Omnitrophota bacterium]